MADGQLDFIDPTEGGSGAKVKLAPRPIDLVGKVVGLLDNTKEQADIILETVAEALRKNYGVAKVLIFKKAHYSKAAAPELMDQIAREVQVAAAAVGG